MKRAVSDLFGGLPISATVETGFVGFTALSTILDGFTVDNKHRSSSLGPTFPAGQIRLIGEPALLYVRERKSLPNGDLDRTERHRAALKGMLLRLSALAAGADSSTAELVGRLWGQVRATGITREDALTLLPVVKAARTLTITSVMVPISRFGMINGASVDILNTGRTAELAAALRSGDLTAYVTKYGTSNAPTG